MSDQDPLALEGTSLRLPRPLWQLKEELKEHLLHEPKRGTQAYNDWASKRVGLAMWIDLAESLYSRSRPARFQIPKV